MIRVNHSHIVPALRSLTGCTSLIIISRKAVYATHWWESISFAPDDAWRKSKTETDEQLFQRTVVNKIKNGGRGHARLTASKIEDDDIKAYLIHPTTNSDGVSDGYRDQWNEIKRQVGENVPTLKDEARWEEVAYEAISDSVQLRSDPTIGTILFKFDPDHNGKQKAMLWVEDKATAYHNDEW